MFLVVKNKNGYLSAKSFREIDNPFVEEFKDNNENKYRIVLNKEQGYYYPQNFSNINFANEMSDSIFQEKLNSYKWRV